MSDAKQPGPEPYLSVVATSRNDDHGGSGTRRMQIFVNALITQAVRHRVPMELILVEWNPPADRLPLADALTWPEDCGWCPVRIVTVPPELHKRFPNSANINLFQMIAKNVGIRRARGEYVLATNVDLIFSDELMAGLAARRLEKGKVYRSIRVDIEADVPLEAGIGEQLDYCRNNVLRVGRPPSMGGPLFLRKPKPREHAVNAIPPPPAGFWQALVALLSLDDADDGYLQGTRWGPRATQRSSGSLLWHSLGVAASLCRAGIVLGAQDVSDRSRLLRLRAFDVAARLRHDLRLVFDRETLTVGQLWLPLRMPVRLAHAARRVPGICIDSFMFSVQRFGRFRRALARPGAMRPSALRRRAGELSRRWRLTAGRRYEALKTRVASWGPHAARRAIRSGAYLHAVLVTVAPLGSAVWRVATSPYRSVRRRVEAKLARFVTFMQGGAEQIPYRNLGEVTDFIRMRNPSARAEVEPLVRLNTLACGDFTLLDRDSWFRIGGNPEYPIYSFHLDSLMIYRAYAAGLPCVDLPPKHVHYHIEHGGGYTPESNRIMYLTWHARGVPVLRYTTLLRLGHDLLKHRPIPYSPHDWGLWGHALAERSVRRMRAGVPIVVSRA